MSPLTVRCRCKEMDIPKWLAELPPNASLNAPDVQRLFGLAYSTLYDRVKRGTFPPHDWETTRPSDHQQKRQWYAATIRKYMKEME